MFYTFFSDFGVYVNNAFNDCMKAHTYDWFGTKSVPFKIL